LSLDEAKAKGLRQLTDDKLTARQPGPPRGGELIGAARGMVAPIDPKFD
jgi:hypothetical protein